MADKKLSAKQITIAYGGAIWATGSTSGLIALLTDLPVLQTIGWSEAIIVGLPSVIVAVESLAKALGKKTPVQIIANAGSQGRAVPINYGNGKQSHVYLSAISQPLKLLGSRDTETQQPSQISIPQSFTVVMDGTQYNVPLPDIRDFIYSVWQRQRNGHQYPFSRTHFTKHKRPKMHTKEYQALMLVLDQVPNLVVNRGQGRSGKLALPPEATVKSLQGLM